MNDIILENLVRKYRNKRQFKILALALYNNLNEDERQKVLNEILALKQANLIFAQSFNLIIGG